jgi:hypothetical protein
MLKIIEANQASLSDKVRDSIVALVWSEIIEADYVLWFQREERKGERERGREGEREREGGRAERRVRHYWSRTRRKMRLITPPMSVCTSNTHVVGLQV